MEKWRRISMRDRILLIVVIIVFLVVNSIKPVLPLEAVFYMGGLVGIMLYIGYINRSIYDLKRRVMELETVLKKESEIEKRS